MILQDLKIPGSASSVLIIDLEAIKSNFTYLQKKVSKVEVGVSIKSDAYGLGAKAVGKLLSAAGCKTFFVSTISEGMDLREILPSSRIIVLNGPDRDSSKMFVENSLTPVLNSLNQIDIWHKETQQNSNNLSYLHVDTGMTRLGLNDKEINKLFSKDDLLNDLKIEVLMSHLACAEEANSQKNEEQLEKLIVIKEKLSPLIGSVRTSLANSAGIFLGSDFHLDLVRAGAFIYGLNKKDSGQDSSKPVIRVFAKIIQVQEVDSPSTVGYGATHEISRLTRIATVATGYADGYIRSSGQTYKKENKNTAKVYFGNMSAPIIGRVSMDLLTIDVSDLPDHLVQPGGYAELIGNNYTVDDLAEVSGTIGYEILVRLGRRHHRVFVGGDGI